MNANITIFFFIETKIERNPHSYLWHMGKIHSHPNLTLRHLRGTYQISGRNFFQVGDDVTTQTFKVFLRHVTCFTRVSS
ncbi:hypothetical protein Hanom_Chr12g01143901 [Helianthus anomalus]